MTEHSPESAQRLRSFWRMAATGLALIGVGAVAGVFLDRQVRTPAEGPARLAARLTDSAKTTTALHAETPYVAPPLPEGTGAIPEIPTLINGRYSDAPAPQPESRVEEPPTGSGKRPVRRLAIVDGQQGAVSTTSTPPAREPAHGKAKPAGHQPSAERTAASSHPVAAKAGSVADTGAPLRVDASRPSAKASPAPTAAIRETTSADAGDRQTTSESVRLAADDGIRRSAPASAMSPPAPRAAGTARPSSDTRIDTVSRAASTSGSAPAPARQSISEWMRQASDLERAGSYAEASRRYRLAAEAGHGPASLRLAELLLEGGNGLHRDYVGAVHWYAVAREQGVSIPVDEKR